MVLPRILQLALIVLTMLACTHPSHSQVNQEPSAPLEPEVITMAGDYIWIGEPDYQGPFKARFTKTKPHHFTVSFHLVLAGENRIYSGTAEGDLFQGVLKGTVQNEVKDSTYRFEGTSTQGVFNGSHVEILQDGAEQATGTITMKIIDPPQN